MTTFTRTELLQRLSATLPPAQAEAAFRRAHATLKLAEKPRYSSDEALAVARAILQEGLQQVANLEPEVAAASFPDLTDSSASEPRA